MDYNGTTAVATAKKSLVQIRREMVGDPVVMGALDPVERAVFLASSAKTVAEYDAQQLTAELSAALKWICKDVGFRATDESERQYLVIRTTEILKRYYSTITLKDFRMAFEMSITGQLDEYLPRTRDGRADRGHYQQFNAEYICKILDAYKARRAAVLKKAFEAVEKPEPMTGTTDKAEYRKQAISDLYEAFDEYRATGIFNASSVAELVFYNILSEYGLAVPVTVTEDEQKQIWQRTVNDYARRERTGDVNRLKANGITDPELEHGAFLLARHKAIKAIFRGLIEQGATIQEFVKFQ